MHRSFDLFYLNQKQREVPIIQTLGANLLQGGIIQGKCLITIYILTVWDFQHKSFRIKAMAGLKENIA